jgi:hypothetical protein
MTYPKPECRELHVTPEKWHRLPDKEGNVRAFCPACNRFLGYVPPQKEQRSEDSPQKETPR